MNDSKDSRGKKNAINTSSSQGEDGGQFDNSPYEKPLKPKKIEDKTGWQLRDENKMIMQGKIFPQTGSGPIEPEGFTDQPTSNKPTGSKK